MSTILKKFGSLKDLKRGVRYNNTINKGIPNNSTRYASVVANEKGFFFALI